MKPLPKGLSSASPVLLVVRVLSTQGTHEVGHLQAAPDELCVLCQPHLGLCSTDAIRQGTSC